MDRKSLLETHQPKIVCGTLLALSMLQMSSFVKANLKYFGKIPMVQHGSPNP
jgi:hypothetical protein